MILFLNDIPFRIIPLKRWDEEESLQYDRVLDLRLSKLKTAVFSGHVLFLNVTPSVAVQILEIQESLQQDLLSVTLVCSHVKAVEDKVKGLYKVVKAAGGVVLKNNQWLLIFRRKKWDLPKGKLDKGETSRRAAVREILEETGVRAHIKRKICTTWHTYTFQNTRILKRTKWYVLECISDLHMVPQASEDIERLVWMEFPEVQKALVNSFSSIRFVAESLRKKQGKAKTT